jgi:hypothetical protein
MSTAHRTSSALSRAASMRARIWASSLITFVENTVSPSASMATAQ